MFYNIFMDKDIPRKLIGFVLKEKKVMKFLPN